MYRGEIGRLFREGYDGLAVELFRAVVTRAGGNISRAWKQAGYCCRPHFVRLIVAEGLSAEVERIRWEVVRKYKVDGEPNLRFFNRGFRVHPFKRWKAE